MKPARIIFTVCLFTACLAFASVTDRAVATDAAFDPRPFVNRYCIGCHGGEQQKGDRRFDSLSDDFDRVETLEIWQEILDAINRGEMPPKGEPRASATELKQYVANLTAELNVARKFHRKEPRAKFRRLNRYEYRNTLRDLCGVNIESFDPTTSFPSDERVNGFENIGEELVISDFLFQRYLEAASTTIEKAAKANDSVRSDRMVFSPNDLCDRRFQFRPQIMFQVNPTGRYVDVGHGDQKSDRLHSQSFEGVSADGYYKIRVEAEGVGRVHPYDPKLLGIDPDEPIKMEVLVADLSVGGRLSGNPTDRRVAIVPLKDNRRQVYEYRVWMDKGYSPLVRYINGPQPIKSRLMKLMPKYHAENLPSNYRSGTDKRPAERMKRYMSDVYLGPRVRVYRMELEGPEPTPLKRSGRYALLGGQADAKSIDSEAAIKRFLGRAFRRPPTSDEVQRYVHFHNERLGREGSVEAALLTTFQAILCAPSFLYIEMPPDGPESSNRAYQLASRLSYFLWSSMPDTELLEAASRGDLDHPDALADQVKRMLRDTKARAFIEHFTDSWLRLNDLGSMPPDSVKFKVYYQRMLETLMKEETRLFFEDVLMNNLSIERFIDADFTYLNRYMADHYGIDGVEGDAFEKVKLPESSPRGGVLGHASVLTATSNGVETSPVTRGIWVLENILGTPPSPPPPDVEPLEPDIRGATTIREQLAKHRTVETCAECHRKIDPLGFALESFDPIGSYREEYDGPKNIPGRAVDTAGRLATGEAFDDLTELKHLLLQRKDQFANCLTEKMLTYALGRELRFQDRAQVDEIVDSLADRGYGLRDLVELIVLSDEFRN